MDMANSLQERRRMPRYSVKRQMHATDVGSKRDIGSIVNLSSSGFMLVCSEPVEVRRYFFLLLELTDAAERTLQLRLEARCLWCAPSSYSEAYGAGFEITYMAPTERRRLQQWIDVAAGVRSPG